MLSMPILPRCRANWDSLLISANISSAASSCKRQCRHEGKDHCKRRLNDDQSVGGSLGKGKATEPAASVSYKINLDQQENVLGIDSFKVDTSFAKINITKATVPMAEFINTDETVGCDAKPICKGDAVDDDGWRLSDKTQLGGILDSTINVTSKGNEFHIQTDNTKITNLLVNTPESAAV